MKRYLLLIALFTLSSVGFINAQPKGCNNAKREAMEAQKVAFITEKVGLTPEEAEKFCKKDMEKYDATSVVFIAETDYNTAHSCYAMEDEASFPVFGVLSK